MARKGKLKRRGFVMTGGGAKGLYEAGVIHAFHITGMEFDVITGSSIGAMNSIFFAEYLYRKRNLPPEVRAEPEGAVEALDAMVKAFHHAWLLLPEKRIIDDSLQGPIGQLIDDLTSFRPVAEKLGLEHQVCQFHVRRWVGRTLRELRETVPKEWQWVLAEVKTLQGELPPEGSKRLFELWKQIPQRRVGQAGARSPLEQLRHLLLRLSEHWDRQLPGIRLVDGGALGEQCHRTSHRADEDAQSHRARLQILARPVGRIHVDRLGNGLVIRKVDRGALCVD